MKRILLCVVAILAVLALVACGGGGNNAVNNPPTTTTPSPSSAPVTVNIGDATSDRLVSFEVAVTSVTLTGSSGATSNLLPATAEVELTHLSGKFEPLRLAGIPAGTYTGATFTLGAAEAVIIPANSAPGTTPIKVELAAPASPISITFPAVTVSSTTASILNFDFNLSQLVSVSGNTVSFASPMPATAITLFAANQPGQVEDEQENENGELEDIHGAVAAVNSSSFVINVPGNSQQLTFNVDANTQFSDGVASLSALKVGMVVKVEGITKADGSLLAKEVEAVEIEQGMEAEGIVTDTSKLVGGVGTIGLTVHEASSAAASSATPATNSTTNVIIGANTKFSVDLGHGKTKASSNFPFDGTHLAMGQKVEADDDTAQTTSIQARRLTLKKQAFSGTVTNPTASGFTLTLDPNSFFLQLNPAEKSIKVVTSAGMITKGAAPANNSTIRVRGLLFFDPTAAAGSRFTLVAIRADHNN